MHRWWLDESAFAGPEHLDPDFVASYDAKAGFDPGDDLDLLRGFGLDEGSLLVDLGAGTGTVALAAAGTGASVIAVDLSPAMVDHLRRRVGDLAATNVAIVESGVLAYRHEGRLADFVYSRNVLHQLPDFWKALALRRVAAMLRPGGVLLLRDLAYDVTPAQAPSVIDGWLDRAATDSAGGYTAEDLARHLRTEFSTYTWLLEPMLERTGFEILDKHVRGAVYARYLCRRRFADVE